jgi:transposase
MDPQHLAELKTGRLRASVEELAEALEGRITAHHRFLLQEHLATVDHLERTVDRFEAQIEAALRPFRDAVERLVTIPGVSQTVAQVIVAEIGVDMGRFPTAGHLLSWAGLCPGLNESAGKVMSRRLRKGDPWLKPVLVQCAWAGARKKDSYLQAQFLRLRARRGPKRAVVAVAASILTAAYHLLRDRTSYRDLGANYFLRVDQDRKAQRLARQIRQLGYEVEIRKAA